MVELPGDAETLDPGGVGIDVAGCDPSGLELRLQVFGMNTIDGEAQRRTLLCSLRPGVDDIVRP